MRRDRRTVRCERPVSSSFRWEPPVDGQRGPRLIRQPLRVAVVAGSALAVVGSFLSWANGQLPGPTPVDVSPMNTADGLLLPIVAGLSVWFVLSESVAASRTRTLQVALAILGVVGLLSWLSALGSANRTVASWVAKGGTGQIGAGIWLAAVGVALIAVPGTILSIQAWRTNGAAGDPTDGVVTRRSIVRATVEAAAGVIGLLGGIALGLVPAGASGLALMAFGSIFGGSLGLWIGNRLARRI
jgi:hypothetical protein